MCTFPCFPGVLFSNASHYILLKPLAAFKHNHHRNYDKRNEACQNDYDQSLERDWPNWTNRWITYSMWIWRNGEENPKDGVRNKISVRFYWVYPSHLKIQSPQMNRVGQHTVDCWPTWFQLAMCNTPKPKNHTKWLWCMVAEKSARGNVGYGQKDGWTELKQYTPPLLEAGV